MNKVSVTRNLAFSSTTVYMRMDYGKALAFSQCVTQTEDQKWYNCRHKSHLTQSKATSVSSYVLTQLTIMDIRNRQKP